MKTLLTLLILIISTFMAPAQSVVNYNDGTFEMIVSIDSTKSQSEIYKAGRALIIKYFKDAKEVIQLDDQESGKLFARGNTKVLWPFFLTPQEITVWFDLDFQVRDGRYRVFCDNVNYEYYVDNYGVQRVTMLEFEQKRSGKAARSAVTDSKQNIIDLMETFQVELNNQLTKKSDW